MLSWSLDAALSEIREIQPLIRDLNFHVALGGGVLNRGESNKDLDLYFLPIFNDKSRDVGRLLTFLSTRYDRDICTYTDKYGDPRGYRAFAQYLFSDRRIDVFVF